MPVHARILKNAFNRLNKFYIDKSEIVYQKGQMRYFRTKTSFINIHIFLY